ncbi:hypothetical protein GCM10010106_04340 [Thermopolyspora flexuosa]|nr:hypothetical protein GCM10010106_04340 [Thermopolyspora flexuosa]
MTTGSPAVSGPTPGGMPPGPVPPRAIGNVDLSPDGCPALDTLARPDAVGGLPVTIGIER